LSLFGEIYVVGFAMTALPVFVATWLLAAFVFGLPLGGGLGWMPALLAAAGAGAVWPVGIIAGVAAAIVVLT
jgi:hypothetical protein